MNRMFPVRIVGLLMLISLSNSPKAQSFSWAYGLSGISGIGCAAIDDSNNILSVGGFRGTIDFDPGPGISVLTAVSNIGGDMFMCKHGSAGNLIWVKHFPGLSANSYGLYGWTIDRDASGNIYLGGTIRDSFDVDSGPALYKLSTNGGEFPYILKLDSAGNFIWAKMMVNSVITNNGGNILSLHVVNDRIFLAGDFLGTLDADPGPGVYNITSTSTGNPSYEAGDLLIEVLDTAGNFIWVKTLGGPGSEVMRFMDIDSLANMYFTGFYQSSVDFDPGPGVFMLNSNIVPPALNSNGYIAKLDSAGNFQWAKQLSPGDNEGRSISISPAGGVFVNGFFQQTVDFDPGPGVYNLTANSSKSSFTLKLNNNGDFKWAIKTGGMAGLNEGRAIATDSLGNVYTASLLNGPADLDPGPGNYFITAGVGIQKLDSSGNFVWGAGVGGEIPGWIGLDNEQSVYCTGSFSGQNIDFDPGPGQYNLNATPVWGQSSGFIVKLCQNPSPVSLATGSSATACEGDTFMLAAVNVPGYTYKWYHDGILMPDTTPVVPVTESGLYIVEAGNGCAGFDSTQLTYYPVDTPTINLPQAIGGYALGQLVSISASITNVGMTFSVDWYRNGILDPNYNFSIYKYYKPQGVDTIFAIIYNNNNPCFRRDTTNLLLVLWPTTVEERNHPTISFYPNPCTTELTISNTIEGEKITLFDWVGRDLISVTATAPFVTLNVEQLPSGSYLLRISDREGRPKGQRVLVRQ